ncbi:creatininase family protein [Egibacter rhizosphaerae]|uniref:creatininase family protein n=1 Tax=Egibacter rhizosphaerae TaxID=1670831 RepID=UPI0013F14B0C|nr:creatininase family protein [Egibacter rhizosphaerae]
MSAPFDLSAASSAELAPTLGEGQVILLPVGATEQHGPNLGLGIDYRIADGLAHRIAERLYGLALVAPPLPFGLSAHHMAFPGTISIGSDAFQAVMTDVVRSLARHGPRHFLFVNGHMGNQAVLSVLTTRLEFEDGLRAASAFYLAQARDVIQEHAVTDRWGHACEIETSVAMVLAPELVHTDALEAGDLIEEYGPYEDNYQPHALQVPKSFAARTRNGAFGDARRANRGAGEEIVETAVDRIAAFARHFVTTDPNA